MGSVNKVILVGNLGKNPEMRYTQGGAAVANMTLATTERYTDKAGQKQEQTEWHRPAVAGPAGPEALHHRDRGHEHADARRPR